MNEQYTEGKSPSLPPNPADSPSIVLPVDGTDWYDSAIPEILRTERPAPLRTMFVLGIILISGVLLGISSAFLLLEREQPLLAVTIGPWSSYPKAGTEEADPYSVAIYTRSARVPLVSGEGLELSARTDSSGKTLDPSCTYRISGLTPPARLWTLTATDRHGHLQPTRAMRSFIDGRQVLRQADGTFVITASAEPHSGNWLPIADPAKTSMNMGLGFTLRLYDAPISTESALAGSRMPLIEKRACR